MSWAQESGIHIGPSQKSQTRELERSLLTLKASGMPWEQRVDGLCYAEVKEDRARQPALVVTCQVAASEVKPPISR